MPSYDDSLTYADAPAWGPAVPPAATPADVWAGYPTWWTDGVDALRDGLAEGARRVFLRLTTAIQVQSVMHLRAHALGWGLDLVARGVSLVRAPGEDDAALRARVGTVDDAVSPVAIRAAVNAALAAVTTKQVRLTEPWKHGLYAGRGCCGRPPVNPAATRLAGGTYLQGAQVLYDVGAIRVWSAAGGINARFHLGLPSLGSPAAMPVARGAATLDLVRVPFGTALTAWTMQHGATFLPRFAPGDTARAIPLVVTLVNRPFASRAPALHVTQGIAALVERLRAAGVVWTAQIDPTI